MPTALITGTSGFIGSHLAQALGKTHETFALGRTPVESCSQNVFWEMTDPLPETLPEQVDLILHAAAIDGRNLKDPAHDCFQINTAATELLLQYARRCGAKQFVYISTGSVYPLSEVPFQENTPIEPVGPYPTSKAAAENLVAEFSEKLQTLTLRLFYPYGIGQKPPRLIPMLVDRIQKGEPVAIHGEAGNPRINPVHVKDVINWTTRLIEQDLTGTFNIAGSESVSIRQLGEVIAELLTREVEFDVGPEQTGNRLGDITRIIAATGYEPQHSLRSGLEEMLQHHAV